MQLRVILEDDLHDTEDGCEFPIYATPAIDEKVTPMLEKSTKGTWFLGTTMMKKYFSVLDMTGVSDDKVNGKVYLGIAECTKHMNRMNDYWKDWHTKDMEKSSAVDAATEAARIK